MAKFRKMFQRAQAGEAGDAAARKASASLAEDAVRLLEEYEKSGRGWFWTTDSSGNVRYVSPGIARILGVQPDDLTGHPFDSLFDLDADTDSSGTEHRERTLQLVLKACKSFSGLPVRAASRDRDVWWSLSGRPRFDDQGSFTGFYGSGEDITETRREMRDASRMALFDSLTGLANRNRMNKLLDAAVRSCKSSHRSSALMMLDLDRFKQVNDSMGHAAGDELLKQVASRITGVVGSDGTVGRMGGDEFQILFPDIEDRGQLGETARKIIAVLNEPFSLEAGRCSIGGSIGIAITPYDGAEGDELVRNADLALYAAKEGGRGRFRFFTGELQVEANRRRQMEEDLRSALLNEQIGLVYQPLVEAGTGKVVALEARLRWQHPDFGDVPPSVFLPLAAKTNLLGVLGNWAIRQACADVVQLPGNVRVAVNVALPQIQEQHFAEVVTQALAASELAPERLELEIEEAAFEDPVLSIEDRLSSLRMLGVRLVIDNYGCAPVAPLRLKALGFDGAKLAVPLVELIASEDERDISIVQALRDLAQACRLEVRADGVEAQDQLLALRKLEIPVVQGGVYSGLLPFADVVDAMASGAWMIEPSGPSRYRSDRRTVFRRVGLIHENFRYEAMMRNLSSSGCLIEGLIDVPVGEQFVLDLGDGQLAVGLVRRSSGALLGLEFEMPLVDDGAGGLVTRNRASREAMAAAGLDGAMRGRAVGLGAMVSPRFAQVAGPLVKNAAA